MTLWSDAKIQLRSLARRCLSQLGLSPAHTFIDYLTLQCLFCRTLPRTPAFCIRPFAELVRMGYLSMTTMKCSVGLADGDGMVVASATTTSAARHPSLEWASFGSKEYLFVMDSQRQLDLGRDDAADRSDMISFASAYSNGGKGPHRCCPIAIEAHFIDRRREHAVNNFAYFENIDR